MPAITPLTFRFHRSGVPDRTRIANHDGPEPPSGHVVLSRARVAMDQPKRTKRRESLKTRKRTTPGRPWLRFHGIPAPIPTAAATAGAHTLAAAVVPSRAAAPMGRCAGILSGRSPQELSPSLRLA